jgi:hypothetical protein
MGMDHRFRDASANFAVRASIRSASARQAPAGTLGGGVKPRRTRSCGRVVSTCDATLSANAMIESSRSLKSMARMVPALVRVVHPVLRSDSNCTTRALH